MDYRHDNEGFLVHTGERFVRFKVHVCKSETITSTIQISYHSHSIIIVTITHFSIVILLLYLYCRYSVTLALTQPDLQILNRTASNPLEFAGFSQPHCSGSSVKSRAEASESTTTIFARNSFARFLCKCNGSGSEAEGTISSRFQETLQNMLVQYQQSPNKLCFNFQTVDRRKCPLVGSISLQKISNETTENDTTFTFVIVIFKKNRGNPVEFIRFFKYIAKQFSDLMMIDLPDS